MQLGPYVLADTFIPGPCGALVRATAEGLDFSVRFLDRAQAEPSRWAALQRRWRLLQLVHHPMALQPVTLALDATPPYLILPAAVPAARESCTARAAELSVGLSELLAQVHRLGLTLGGRGPLVLYEHNARCWLDLTDTLEAAGRDDFADDVARLGDLLLDLFGTQTGTTNAVPSSWLDIVQQMRATNTDERPLAEEVAVHFRPPDLQGTLDSSEVQHTLKTHVGTISSLPTVPHVGDVLGRFRLVEKLGEGAVGVVFRGEDQADGQTVAIKVLKPTSLASEKARRRFVKEGRLLAALDTPFVTRLLEVNTDVGVPFIALEFVAGRSLGDVLRKNGPLAEDVALAYVADAARGLAVAHALGMVHRDIKPDNLLLGADGRVRVTDFGMAREIEQSQSLDITHDGATLGTPLYMAPEQFGSSKIDTRADVYALGATLYHMLAGRPPFLGQRLAALAKAVATEPPPPLEKLNSAVSLPVAALVMRLLAKDPKSRPADAGLLLDELERLRSGEQPRMAQHPVDPAMVGNVRVYSFVWELRGTPEQLWPHVSNTERLNRAIGMPAAKYELQRHSAGGVRRMAKARAFIGLKLEWEEHPFEWIEGRRMGILREFRTGPFKWFISTVDLQPSPSGGTTLRHTLRVEPRGLMGRILAPLQMGGVAGKVLGKVYAHIDAAVQAADPQGDPFEDLAQLPAAKRRLLAERIDALTAHGAAPEGTQLLYLFLAHAPDQEVARLRPLALAARFGVAENVVIEACLRAVSVGLLQLQWDIICPLCRIPSGRKNTLRELKEHENCPTCDKDFQTDFAAAVELVFQVHPEIRRAESGTYCAGGPAHSPHVVAQTRLGPGERIELDLSLSEGLYRVRSTQLPWTLELRVRPGAGVRRWEMTLAAATPVPALAVSGQRLLVHNDRAHEVILRIERTAARADALTAAKALAVPAFRELFPGELLSPGQLAPASSVTLVLLEVIGVDTLLHDQGEALAFQHIQRAFRCLEALARREQGTVIKSVGDALLVSFAELAPAVRWVLACAQEATFSMRASVHRGMVLVATVDDRLDYFGHTTKILARLLAAATTGEVLLSAACAGDPEVTPLIQGKTLRMGELPGVPTLLACRVRLQP